MSIDSWKQLTQEEQEKLTKLMECELVINEATLSRLEFLDLHSVHFARPPLKNILEGVLTHQDKEDKVWIDECVESVRKKLADQGTRIKPYYRSKERW